VLSIALGRPSGVVRIRLRGGVGDVTVVRPAGTAVILHAKGGYRKATIDGVAVRAGTRRLSTPDADRAPDRFEIELQGGANKLTVKGE
jgi:hypothetical protein